MPYEKEYLICNKDGINEIISEIYKRINKPFYLFLLSSIVILLIISNHEEKKFKNYKFFIFFLGILMLIISEISVNFSGVSNLNLTISIVLPFIIFIFLYFLFYAKVYYKERKR